ncbi:MAG: YchJ family metal-binding protein [Desulfotalea sp.]
MIKKNDLCPCGSSEQFQSCCMSILKDIRLAKTAVQLMRSRYTAFVLEDEKFLLKSWAKKKRPKRLNFSSDLKWLGLKVHNTTDGIEGDLKGKVYFTAKYIENGAEQLFSEESNFRKTKNIWYYVDGDINPK